MSAPVIVDIYVEWDRFGWVARINGYERTSGRQNGPRIAAHALAKLYFGHGKIALARNKANKNHWRAGDRDELENAALAKLTNCPPPVKPSPTAFGDWTGD